MFLNCMVCKFFFKKQEQNVNPTKILNKAHLKLKHTTAMERSKIVPLAYCCCKYA